MIVAVVIADVVVVVVAAGGAAGVGVFGVLCLRLDSPPGVSAQGFGEVIVNGACKSVKGGVVLGFDGFPCGVAQRLGKVVVHRFCWQERKED